MKICAISPFRPIRGGIALNSTFLYNQISKYHEVIGITYSTYLPKFKVSEYVHSNSEVLPIFPIYPLLDYKNPVSYVKVMKLIDAIKPDLITFQWVSPIIAYQILPLAIFAKKRGIKTLMTIHNVIPHERSILDVPLMRLTINYIDALTVHYKKQREELCTLFSVDESQVHVAPLAKYEFEKIEKTTARDFLNLEREKKIVLFYGMVRKYKGLELLIEAMKNIKDPDIHLFVCGAFMHKSANFYRKLVDKWNLNEKVTIMAGYSEKDSVNAVFSAADLQVLPYLHFSSQSAAGRIGEYFHLPMIVTPYGGLPELSGIYSIVKPSLTDIADTITNFFKETQLDLPKFNDDDVGEIYSEIFKIVQGDKVRKRSKLNICMATSSFPRYVGDIWGPWILEYSYQLAQLGVNLHVLCPKTNATGEKAFQIMKGVHVHRFKYWPFKNWQNLASPPGIIPNIERYRIAKFQVAPFIFFGFISLLKLIKENHIDIILAQWVIPAGFWGINASTITNRPILIFAQGAEFFVRNKLSKIFVRQTMKRSDLVIPVSHHMKRMGMSFGLSEDLFRVVPNAVNLSVFKRTKPHWSGGTFRILTVRRLVKEKRVEDLIVAFSNFIKTHDDVKLVIIGDGPERNKLETLSVQLDCKANIEFLGFIPNSTLPAHYNSSDVYVLSSVQEGLSLTLLEAMASELPVISTNIVGNPEVIQHKKNGYLVSPKSSQDIEEGLEFFYNNRERLSNFGKEARLTVSRGFNSKSIAKQILKISNDYIQKEHELK